MSGGVSAPIDLTGCEREPIHIPGAIQPHGALRVIDERTFTVAQVSEMWKRTSASPPQRCSVIPSAS
jgi:light-regulated signal transduction histidine kinase (bacteriophytochrome)